MTSTEMVEVRRKLALQVFAWPSKDGLEAPSDADIGRLLFYRWAYQTGRITDHTPELIDYYTKSEAT